MSVGYLAPPELCALSLHDALPISSHPPGRRARARARRGAALPRHLGVQHRGRPRGGVVAPGGEEERSEEHTSELQSLNNLVCRLLVDEKKAEIGRAHV